MILFLELAVGHFLCDYPLQGDFLAAAKNHKKPIPAVPWQWGLLSHAAIQAGMVWYLTGLPELAFAELFFHAAIDYLKCDGVISYTFDQIAHLVCKAVYALCA